MSKLSLLLSILLAMTVKTDEISSWVPKILTWNIYAFPQLPFPEWFLRTLPLSNLTKSYSFKERTEAIGNHELLQGADIIVFSEMFNDGVYELIKGKLKDTHPHSSPILMSKRRNRALKFTITNGGSVIFSKCRILTIQQFAFKKACGSDKYASKGFFIAEIDAPQRTLIVSTHLQATDDGCNPGQSAQIRKEQLTYIYQVLSLRASSDDIKLAFLVGDLNVNYGSAEYIDSVERFDTGNYTVKTNIKSFDTKHNGIALRRVPESPVEHLDYIIPFKGVNNYVNEALNVTYNGSNGKVKDYSDHYPLLGYLPENI